MFRWTRFVKATSQSLSRGSTKALTPIQACPISNICFTRTKALKYNIDTSNLHFFNKSFFSSNQVLDSSIYREALGHISHLSPEGITEVFNIILKYSSKGAQALSLDEATRLVIVLYKAGCNQRDSHNHDKALEFFNEAVNLADKLAIKDASLLGAIKSSIGKVYIQLNDLPKAEKYLEKASTIFKTISDSEKLPEAKIIHTFYLAALYEQQGKLQQASELLNKLSSTIDEGALGAETVSSLYDNLGRVSMKRQHTRQAIDYWKKGLDVIVEKTGKETLQARSFFRNLAIACKEQQDFFNAQLFADEWLNASLKGTNDKDENNIISILAFLCELSLQQGDMESAINMSKDLADALKYFPNLNIGELNNAYLCLTTANYYGNIPEEAQGWYTKALETVTLANDKQKLKIAEKFVHWALFLTHNPDTRSQAKDLCDEAEHLYEVHGDSSHAFITNLYNTRGIISLSDENFEEAVKNFNECLRLATNRPDSFGQLEKTNHLLSLTHLKQHKIPEAIEFQKDSVQACVATDDASRNLSSHYFFLGELYVVNDMLDESLSVFHKGLDLSVKEYGEQSETSQAAVKGILKVLEKQNKHEEVAKMKQQYNIE